MLKFAAKAKDGKPLLGISEGNVERLREGKPIHVPAEQTQQLAGAETTWAIMYGETEEALLDEASCARPFGHGPYMG
jgi:hypothetical protein